MSHSKSSELQSALESWQYFAPCLGANVAIYDANEGYWISASGFSQPDPPRKLKSDECFYIYSITKTFTAIVVMRLVEKNVLSLVKDLLRVLKR